MQFEYTDPQTDFEKLFGGHHDINAYGTIEPDDDQRFRDFLARAKPPLRTMVYIDSAGGDVEAAINIGRAIRDNWFSTTVGLSVLKPPGEHPRVLIPRERVAGRCMSAATLIFLGGRLRVLHAGSKFGVHQFSFKNPSPHHIGQSQILSAKIASYIADMGISSAFLEISSAVDSATIEIVDEARLKELNVLSGWETDVSWTVQARSNMLYVRGERDSFYGHHKVSLGYVKQAGFLFLATIEAQGREAELTTDFGVVEIVINGEKLAIDISDRATRFVVGQYVNIACQISQDEARLIAHADSFGVMVRATREAPMFLGVSAMSTEGGREQLETFFAALSLEH